MVEEASKEHLKGIGGWLSFFIFTLIISLILNFIVGISDISTVSESGDIALIILDVILWLAFIGFNIYTIYVLVKVKENAISVAKMYVALVFLTNILGVIFAFFTGGPIASEESYLDSSTIIIRSLIYSIIWFLYLIYSKRIENTYPKKERKSHTIDKIWFFVILAIPLVIYFLAYIGTNYDQSLTDGSNPISLQPITDELSPGYVIFKPFTNQYSVGEMNLEFSSNLPISVYFVPTEGDYDKFMAGDQYSIYQGCSFEEKTFGVINCNVSSGGIIIYNPNLQNVTYQIE